MPQMTLTHALVMISLIAFSDLCVYVFVSPKETLSYAFIDRLREMIELVERYLYDD